LESTTITLTIDVDVYLRTIHGAEGYDADDTREVYVTDRIIDHVEVSEGVPREVESWAIDRARELFEAGRY
jgi:hypothetical protein